MLIDGGRLSPLLVAALPRQIDLGYMSPRVRTKKHLHGLHLKLLCWPSSMMDCDMQDEINLYFPKLPLIWVFITAIEKIPGHVVTGRAGAQ